MQNISRLIALATLSATLAFGEACASTVPPAPSPTSPLSPQAEEPAAPPIATSLTQDPLAG